jgi:hypothetical protein
MEGNLRFEDLGCAGMATTYGSVTAASMDLK